MIFARAFSHYKYIVILCLLLFCPSLAHANANIQGWCEDGSQNVITSGLTSSTLVQASYPNCVVTVLIHGGGLATIYSNNSGSVLANPFTATDNGQWLFYAAQGRYDVTLSGGGMPSTVTYSDIVLYDPAQQATTLCTVTFSTTPAFTANLCSLFQLTMTANVTSSTITGGVVGQLVTFSLAETGGPWTFTWPTTFLNPPLLTGIANKNAQFTFVLLADGFWHNTAVGESVVFNTATNGNQLFINNNLINAITGTGNTAALQTAPTFFGQVTLDDINTVLYVGGTTYPTVASAVTALASTGGEIIVPCGNWPITPPLTIAPPGQLKIQGCGIGSSTSGGTRLVPSSTASPVIAVQGTSASARTTDVLFRDLTIGSGTYSASQVCVLMDHVTEVDYENVQFIDCGQAEFINDAYRVPHTKTSYYLDGSGGTSSTCMVGVQNTSNPSVPTEEVFFDNSNWQGQTGQQGCAVYFGTGTNQERISNSKMDFNGTGANFCLVQIFSANIVNISGSTISDSDMTAPATGTICVDGTSGVRSNLVTIVDNPELGLNNSIPGVWLNYTQNYNIGLNGFAGLGGGGYAVSATSLAFGGNVLGNRLNSLDIMTLDNSGLMIALNPDDSLDQWDLVTPLNTTKPIVSLSTISTTGGIIDTSLESRFNRLYCNQGTALTLADITSSTGWGTGATFAIAGTDCNFVVQVTTGGSPSSEPSLTVTFHNGTWQDGNPICQATRGDGSAPFANGWSAPSTSTTVSPAFLGTPVATTIYTVDIFCPGR